MSKSWKNTVLRSISLKLSLYIVNFQSIPSRLKCILCEDILVEPIQTDCGCRFCLSCFVEYIEKNSNKCPNCKLDDIKFIKDRAIERESFNLQINCLNNGCSTICLLKNLEEHLSSCDFRLEECVKCCEMIQLQSKEQHLIKYCSKVIVKCNDCGLEMTRIELESSHINIDYKNIDKLCEKWKGDCPNNCKSKIDGNMKNHLNICPLRLINCVLSEMGCSYSGNSNEIANHMTENLSNHMLILISEITKLKSENENLKLQMKNEREILIKQIENVEKTNKEINSELKRIQTFSNKNSVDVNMIKSEIDNYKQILGGNFLNDLSVINGICTWVIRNIKSKINEAKIGLNKSIVSEAFYLYQPGYRMCLKIYPNGDGQSENNYISIYFVIMKGDYDEELSWPFQQKVSLTLLSNNRDRENIVIKMKPDNNRSCYGKPINNANLGSGIPSFVKLSEILSDEDNYLHEDDSLKIVFSFENRNDNYQNFNQNFENVKKIK